MKDAITPARIANQIRMRRSGFSGTFLIVEGETDVWFYKNFIDNKDCKISPAINKQNAIVAIQILDQDNFKGVLAIVDADFDNLESTSSSSPNILLTDEHDLEIMILKSPALEKVMREFGSQEKLEKYTNDIRCKLLELGQEIGYLRWLSLIDNLSLKFEGLTYTYFINKDSLKLDLTNMYQAVKNKSQKPSLDENTNRHKIKALQNNTHDLWQVCCGHDLICILAIGLCKMWGTCSTTDVKTEILERSLRLAYETSYFKNTQLYTNIVAWEEHNTPYRVLK